MWTSVWVRSLQDSWPPTRPPTGVRHRVAVPYAGRPAPPPLTPYALPGRRLAAGDGGSVGEVAEELGRRACARGGAGSRLQGGVEVRTVRLSMLPPMPGTGFHVVDPRDTGSITRDSLCRMNRGLFCGERRRPA